MRFRWLLGWYSIYPLAKVLIGFRTEGREQLSRLRKFILAANHTANLDPFILGLAAKHELHFLAKAELFRPNKFFAWLIRAYNAIPLRRAEIDITAIKKVRELLRYRQSVMVFPEGARSRTGEFQPFKAGIGLLAITEQVPTVPAYIYGIRDSFIAFAIDRDIRHPSPEERKAGSVLSFIRRQRRIGVRFGTPIYPNGYKRSKEDYLRYTEEVNRAIQNLVRNSHDLVQPKNKNKED